ncbi:MAG: 2OG-Fe(II) oxygenase [Thiotrichales bacterium]
MTTINDEITEILGAIQNSGRFYAAGTIAMPLPGLEVDGVGAVALPLLPLQLTQLVAAASQAPYGRGSETLVDVKVRRAWQIDAAQVHLRSHSWLARLDEIVAQVVEDLGCRGGSVTAELYKLLIYEEGGFFLPHRDTEKSSGMFATLIVALPSAHTGGALRIAHAGQSAEIELRSDDPGEIAFAAFYADCVHEVLPIERGCRIVLVYNLCRAGDVALPAPVDYRGSIRQLSERLREWTQRDASDETPPRKLIYLLEHAYTPAALAFDALKGADAGVANVLSAAAGQAGCECCLARVTVEESGIAECDAYYGGRRWGGWHEEFDAEDFIAGEVIDRAQFLSEWQFQDGSERAMGALPFEDDELCLPERLRDLEPDEQHFHEATGNEGASYERTYGRAALVVWPQAETIAVLSVGGVELTVPYLAAQVRRWRADGGAVEATAAQALRRQAEAVIVLWNDESSGTNFWQAEHERLGELLEALVALRDDALIEAAITRIAMTGRAYLARDNAAIHAALAMLAPVRARRLLVDLVVAQSVDRLPECANLLARALAEHPAEDLRPAALALVANLPREPVAWRPQGGESSFTAEVSVDILTATGGIDLELGRLAIQHWLAHPRIFSMDEQLIPAVLQAADQPQCPREMLVHLRDLCVVELDARIAQPLAPPTDWARAADIRADSADLRALADFLANPHQETWAFCAAERRRGDLEHAARHANADVTMTTERKGRPYTLHFTKTQASYERRVRQRLRDECNRTRLLAVRAH